MILLVTRGCVGAVLEVSHVLLELHFLELRLSKNTVVFLTMSAESGPLFELEVAARELAGVRMLLSVGVHVLHQVLLLGKLAVAHVALELLDAAVDCNEVSLETKPGGKRLVATWHGADVCVFLLVDFVLYHHIVDLKVLFFHVFLRVQLFHQEVALAADQLLGRLLGCAADLWDSDGLLRNLHN